MAHKSASQLADNRGQEDYAVVELIERLAKHKEGRLALIIRLSRLQPHNRREHHLRIAGEVFEEAVHLLEGKMFVLSGGDLIYVGRTDGIAALEKSVERLCVLFHDDPLIQAAGDGPDTHDSLSFSSWYYLDQDYDRLLAETRAVRDRAKAARSGPPSKSSHAKAMQSRAGGNAGQADPAQAALGVPDARQPLGPSTLARVNTMLERADISSLARNQAICSIPPDGSPTRLFDEIYVSISDLERIATPGIALGADPWMFRSLTQTLDRRLLSYLAAESQIDRSVSMNLNVSTLLSPEFRNFDHKVNGRLRGRLILELAFVDIVSDMRAYLFARELLRERGYRICIDGITYQTLHMCDREKLGADLVKILWSPELNIPRSQDDRDAISRFVVQQGRARIILCRCDDNDAISIGQNMGIVLFQGRHVDKLLRQGRSIIPS